MKIRMLGIPLVTAAVLVLTGCGNGSNDSTAPESVVSVDVGIGDPVEVRAGERLRIAYFIEGANNAAGQATAESAKKRAEELGADLEVFDARFDGVTQRNQMESALNRDYDGWVVAAVDGQQACDLSTKRAPAREILVAVETLPICGRAGNEGEELWAPGTVSYVGGAQTPSAFQAVMERALTDQPDARKVALLTGPELNPITINFDKGTGAALAKRDGLEVITVRTDYGVADAQKKVEPLLQANPDIGIVVAAFSSLSRGTVAALQGLNKKPGDVPIYDAGGTRWAVGALEQGWIETTTAYYRPTASATTVQTIVDAAKGKPVKRVTLNNGHALLPGQREEDPVFIVARESLDAYRDQAEID